RAAVYAAEELEETAKLAVLLANQRVRSLSAQEIAQLEERYAATMR
ncbi:hypothetical protein SAMN06265221_1691, partial [Paracoccus laeviglucosivorans]